ncbi:MAG: arylesterase [Alphaproteobacteria bacterium]|nr:MAG: arylesterase [Alphaproteobacteria bacterium]
MKYYLLIIINLILITTANGATSRILFLGDSLGEGQGIGENPAFPKVVERNLRAKKHDVTVINDGVSGSISASGLSRLKWQLKNKVDILVLELGANDGLRGFKLKETEKNLKEIIAFAKSKNIKVLLLGVYIPPNYGIKYSSEFANMYKRISKTEKIPLLPFLLKDVAGIKELNLPDGIHPNAKGHEVIGENVAKFIEKNL